MGKRDVTPDLERGSMNASPLKDAHIYK